MKIDIQKEIKFCLHIENENSVIFKGDYTSQRRVIIYVGKKDIIVRDSWGKIFEKLNIGTVEVAKEMCGLFLRTSFIPPPYTIYSNIFLLTVGDYLEIKEKEVEDGYELNYWTEYPFLSNNSSGESRLDNSIIESLIKKSFISFTSESRKTYDNIYLMHSAGKDSNAILYSIYKELGEKLKCVTYNADIQEKEYLITKEICKDLGVKHICINSDPKEEFISFLDFIGRAKSITGDFALPGYVYTMDKISGNGNLILDGLGSDIYMGAPLSGMQKLLCSLSIPHKIASTWGHDSKIFNNYKISFLLQSLFMFPAERLFPSIRLSKNEIKSLVGINTTSVKETYKKLTALKEDLDDADWRSYVMRLFETGSSMEKGRLATSTFNQHIYYPYCNRELIDTFLNLPQSDKYSSSVNKLPIRTYLKTKTNYDKYVKNKGSFRYDIVSFINQNSKKVLEEIDACPIYNTAGKEISRLLKSIDNRASSTKIYLMFILASWINRNDFNFTQKHVLDN